MSEVIKHAFNHLTGYLMLQFTVSCAVIGQISFWLVIWCYSSLSPVLWSVRSVSDWLFDVTVHCLLCCDRSDQFLTGYLMLQFTVSCAVIGQISFWLVIWCYSSLSPVLWSVRSVSDWLFDVTVHCLLCCDRSDQFLTGYLMLQFTVSCAVIGQISFWLVIWCYSSLSPVLWSVRSVSDWLFDVTVHCLLCCDRSDQFLTDYLMLQFTVSCAVIGQISFWLVIWCYSSLSPVLWSVRSVSDWLFDVTVHCLLCCDRSDQFLTGYLMLQFTVSCAVIGQISFWLVIWCYSSVSCVVIG